jgi:hypothetical protein
MVKNKVPDARSPYSQRAIANATFPTIGAEIANVITVAVQLKSDQGTDLAVRGSVQWYLSDDAAGDVLVATAPDGGVAGGTDGWTSPTVTGKRGQSVSENDGDIDIAITHAAGAKTVYLNIILPDGTIKTSPAITFA